MRIKKRYLFNEEKYAEEIIRDGFEIKGIDYGAMYSVAKYFRAKFGFGRIRLRQQIIDFCKQHDPFFNPVVEADSIKKWVDVAMKYDLRIIDEIEVSAYNIRFLKENILKEKDRKVLFAVLVFARAIKKANELKKKKNKYVSDKYYMWYSNLIDIAQITKLTKMTELKVVDVLHKHKDLFTFYPPEKELIRIDFISNEGKQIPIKNMDDIMIDYNLLFGKNTCEKCGKPIEKKSNRQKYCEDCSKIAERERKAKWKREQTCT